MEKKDTIENRVYLFESLARGYVENDGGDLGSKNPSRRARALRALADLAYVSCVVADTQEVSPKQVRAKVLEAVELAVPDEAEDEPGDEAEAEPKEK